MIVAAELVSESLIANYRDDSVLAAATNVLQSDLPEFTKNLASTILGDETPHPASVAPAFLSRRAAAEEIHIYKASLAHDPRNAILWTDLSLAYTSIGQAGPAAKALRNALILAPDNRFVLRSAVRFYVHHSDPERAVRLLRSNAASSADPWLIAAEVAVSTMLGLTPKFVKPGRQALESGRFNEFHLSELSGSLASLEMAAGAIRNSRKLFRRALSDPTDNAVAQATWAAFVMKVDVVESEHLQAPRSYEARARDAAHGGDWTRAISESQFWLLDQPFSVGASAFGSYVASIGRADYATGLNLAQAGLTANPDSTLLRNNVAFCLASSGDPQFARRILSRIPQSVVDKDALLLATFGLIEFRSGRADAGRELYRRALQMFHALDLPKSRAVAAIYLAREELLADTVDAPGAVSFAHGLADDRTEPEVLTLLGRLDVTASKPRSRDRDIGW